MWLDSELHDSHLEGIRAIEVEGHGRFRFGVANKPDGARQPGRCEATAYRLRPATNEQLFYMLSIPRISPAIKQ